MNAAALRGLPLTIPNPPNPIIPTTAVRTRINFLSNRSDDHPTSGAPNSATNWEVPVKAAASEYACRHPLHQTCSPKGNTSLISSTGACGSTVHNPLVTK